MKHHLRHIYIILILGLLAATLLLILSNIYQDKISLSNPITFGVSYSPRYAQELNLDPKKTYQDILQNLAAKHIRLNAYWNEIEVTKDKFSFDDLDWYINQASQHKAQVILAIGYKLPRWPECRVPEEYNNYNFLRERELIMLQAIMNHFESNPTILAFQLENEPLLDFGVCPKVDREFLDKEVKFVKAKTQKPIIITDSGELRFWRTPMQLSDIFGTTLYRIVDTPWFGPFQYPLRPWFYRTKSDLVRKFFAPKNQKTIISELQAEPWGNQPLTQTPLNQQLNRFSLDQFKESVDFAKKTGFSEAYLWGAEWWYFMAKNNHPEYLEYAKSLF